MSKLNTRTTVVRAMSIALGLALTLFVLPTVTAQDDRHPPRDRGDRHAPSPEEREQRMQERMSRMQDNLQLTDEQISRLQPIFAEQGRKMHALRQEQQKDRENHRAAMQDLHKATNTQVSAIMTGEQFEQYREHQKRQRQRQRQQHAGGRGQQGGDHDGARGGDRQRGHRPPPPPDDNPEF